MESNEPIRPAGAESDAAHAEKAAESNPFLDSLAHITAQELGKAPALHIDPAEKRRQRLRRMLSLLSILLFLAALAFFVYRLVAYDRAEGLYRDLQDTVIGDASDDGVEMRPDSGSPTISPMSATGQTALIDNGTTAQGDQKKQNMLLQLQRLKAMNSDAFAWISIPGESGETEIEYPLMSGGDEYYLYHAYDKTYNPTGSIFLAEECSRDLDANYNTVIWGHNMAFGTPMFRNLPHYADRYYWARNRYIFIYTEEKTYRYEIFSAYPTEDTITGIGYFTTEFAQWSDREQFLQQAINASQIGAAPELLPTANDQILTLCTCIEDGERRFAVHARRMQDYELINGEDNLDDTE